MYKSTIIVDHKSIQVPRNGNLLIDHYNKIFVLDFSSEPWDNIPVKNICFRINGQFFVIPNITSTTFIVPDTILASPFNENTLYIGIQGVDNNNESVYPTPYVRLGYIRVREV